MNKKLMSILMLTLFTVSSVPRANAGGGNVAAGVAAGGITGLIIGYLIGNSMDKGDPVAKEKAADMREKRRAATRKEREMRQQQRDKDRAERQARKRNKRNGGSTNNDSSKKCGLTSTNKR